MVELVKVTVDTAIVVVQAAFDIVFYIADSVDSLLMSQPVTHWLRLWKRLLWCTSSLVPGHIRWVGGWDCCCLCCRGSENSLF